MDQEDNELPDLSVVYKQLNKKDLGFRPKKLTISKDIYSQSCDICAIAFDRKFQYQERGMAIISCYGCGLSCHLYCYGISTAVELSDHTNNQGYFVCDRCKFNQKQDQICFVCSQKGGLKKQINDCQDFVHPLCGLTTKTLEVVSFMELKFRKSQHTKQQTQQCHYCKGLGATIKCNSDCSKYAHIYCMIFQINNIGGYNLNYCESNKSNVWEIDFNYKQLFGSGNLQGQFNDIKVQVKAQAKSIIKQFMSIQQVTIDVDIDQIFDQYACQEKMEEEKEQLIYIFRSLIQYFCMEHHQQEVYCKCRENTQNDEMIECDTCSEWFHQSCLMTVDEYEEQKKKDNYYCTYCQQWTQNKLNKILKHVPVTELSELLPPFLKIQFHTLIILGIYCERSLQQLINQYSEHEYAIIETILGNLPFHQALSTQISQIKEKSHIAEFMNYLLKQVQYKSDEAWKILSQIDEKCSSIQKNITHNNKLKAKLKKVIILFKDYDECQYFTAIQDQLTRVQNAYDIIMNKTKITKEEIKQYPEDGFHEFIWLHDQLKQYKEIKQHLIDRIEQVQGQFLDFMDKIEPEDSEDYSDGDEINLIYEFLERESQKVKTPEDFFNLVADLKIRLHQMKLSKTEIEQIIHNFNQLIIEVPWLEQLQKELDEGVEITTQLAQVPLVYEKKLPLLDELIDQLEEYPVHFRDFPEQYRFLSKVQLYEHYMQDLQIPEKDEDDSELQAVPKDISIKISKEHLDTVMSLANEIQVEQKDKDILNQLEAQLNEFRKKLRGMIEQRNLNEQMRKKFQAELSMNKTFDAPEIKELQQRLEIFTEVDKVRLAKSQTLQQLEQCLEKSKLNYFDEKIITYFEQEINKCQQKKKEIKILLENEIFEQEQLDQAKQLLQEISQSKIVYEEKQLLQSLNKACILIENLYEFYQKFKSPDQEMEIEDDKNPELQFKINQVANPFNILFKDENDSIIAELDAIISKQHIILDQRIKNVYESYQQFLWQKQVKSLLSQYQNRTEISLQLIEAVLASSYQLDESDSQQLIEFTLQYNNQSVLANQSVQTIGYYLFNTPKEELLQMWFNTCNQITLLIKGGMWDQLKIYNLWVTVIQKYVEITSAAHYTYESLKVLQEIMGMAHIPKNTLALQLLQQKITSFNILVERLRDYNNKRTLFLEKRDTQKGKSIYTLRDANQLWQDLEVSGISHEFLSKDLYQDLQLMNQIQEDFNQAGDITLYAQLYQRLIQSFIQDQQLMDKLKINIYSQKIQDILKGNKTVELAKAKKQLNNLVQLLAAESLPPFVTEFQEQLMIAEEVQSIVNNIRNNQQYTFEELEQASQDLEKISNIVVEKSQDVEIKYQECVQVQNEINDIQKSKLKAKEIVIQTILEKLQNLPLTNERNLVQKWLTQYEQVKQSYANLRQTLSKQKANPNGKELTDLMNSFQKSYNEIIIIFSDADHFIKEYQEFGRKLEQIESNINTEQAFNEFHDLLSIFRWGEQFERVKIALWMKQVLQFRENQAVKWGFAQFRNMLNQGYEIIDQALSNNQKLQLEKMKSPLQYLESLMVKLIDYVASGSGVTAYVEGKIDAYQLSAELQHISQSDRLERLRELQPKKPFDDLNAYFEKKQRQQRKKVAPVKEVEYVGVKKVKKQPVQSSAVSESLREQKKKELLQILQVNPIFMKKDSQYLEGKAKEIENQGFGEFNTNKDNYIEMMSKLIAAFKEIQTLPYFSRRVLSKGFAIDQINYVLKKYEGKKMQSIEEQLRSKHKLQPHQDYNPLAPNKNKVLSIQPLNQKQVKQQQPPPTKPATKEDVLNQILNDSFSNLKLQHQQQLQQQQQRITPQFTSIPVEQPKQQIISQQSLPSQQKSISQQRSPSDNSSNESSDLPELKVPDPQGKPAPILYNPDEDEPKAVQNVSRVEVTPLQFCDRITKIGKRYKTNVLEKSISCEFYTTIKEDSLKYFPKFLSELKHQKLLQPDAILSQMEKQVQRGQWLLIVGWVLPERLQDLGEFNRIAESLKKDQQQIVQYSLNDTNVYLAHYDQLMQSQLFYNFKCMETVTEYQFQKKDSGIVKYWGNAIPKLCFIIQVKYAPNAIMLSSFNPLQVESVKNIIKSREVIKWVESKIAEQRAKKQQQQQQQQLKPELEPVTSEEEVEQNNQNNNQIDDQNTQKNNNGQNDLLQLQALMQDNQDVMGALFQ